MFIATWTDELIERLVKLFHEGLSARLIAEQLGVTRNAVIGKLHRANLRRPVDAIKKVVSKGGGAPRKAPAGRARPAIAYPRVVRFAPVVTPHHIGLMELREHHCRYPYDGEDGGPTTYCGNAKHTGSWCEAHHFACTEIPYKMRKAA